MNKGTETDENVNMYCDKNKKKHFTEIDNTYCCIRILKFMDMIISKTKDYICKTMLTWREFKIPVKPSARLFENHIVCQMENSVGGLADNSEDHIERSHQDGKRSERIYYGLINFKQSLISQLKNNDMMTNLQVKLKSEQIKTNRKEI